MCSTITRTDRDGSATFMGVPPNVHVTVTAQSGSFSSDYAAPPTGFTEMRMVFQTTGMEEATAMGGGGGRPGPGDFGF